MYYMIIKLSNGPTIITRSTTADFAEKVVKESFHQPFPPKYEVEHIIKGVEINYQQLKFTAGVERNENDDSKRVGNACSIPDNASVSDPQLKLDL